MKFFTEELRTIKGVKAKLNLEDNVKPVFTKVRSIICVLCPEVEAELDQLEKRVILTKVMSKWASLIIPGTIWICRDYKAFVNSCLKPSLDKCEFFMDRITYCGHEVSVFGLQASSSNEQAI